MAWVLNNILTLALRDGRVNSTTLLVFGVLTVDKNIVTASTAAHTKRISAARGTTLLLDCWLAEAGGVGQLILTTTLCSGAVLRLLTAGLEVLSDDWVFGTGGFVKTIAHHVATTSRIHNCCHIRRDTLIPEYSLVALRISTLG